MHLYFFLLSSLYYQLCPGQLLNRFSSYSFCLQGQMSSFKAAIIQFTFPFAWWVHTLTQSFHSFQVFCFTNMENFYDFFNAMYLFCLTITGIHTRGTAELLSSTLNIQKTWFMLSYQCINFLYCTLPLLIWDQIYTHQNALYLIRLITQTSGE